MSELINDWRPETTGLINRLTAAGFEIVGAFDGEENAPFESVPKMVKFLTAVDEARLWLFLVYGNKPGYLVNDWQVPTSEVVAKLLDKEIMAHGDEYERKGQPKATREEIYG